jgi:hypothetical protein
MMAAFEPARHEADPASGERRATVVVAANALAATELKTAMHAMTRSGANHECLVRSERLIYDTSTRLDLTDAPKVVCKTPVVQELLEEQSPTFRNPFGWERRKAPPLHQNPWGSELLCHHRARSNAGQLSHR